MPKIIDFDDLDSVDSILSGKKKQEDGTIKDEEGNIYNEKGELLDEEGEVDVKSQVLKEMKEEMQEELRKAEEKRIKNLEEKMKEKQEEIKRMREEEERKRKEGYLNNEDEEDDYSLDPFSNDEADEEERVKKVFINEIMKYKSNFREGFNGIDFSYKSIEALLIESISVKETSSEEIFFDDSINFKTSMKRRLYKIPSGESEYDHLNAMKGNRFEYYKEDDIIDKDCHQCYGTGEITCKVCKGEKELICKNCMGECVVQEKIIEKKLIDKGSCPICGGTKNKPCGTCMGSGFIIGQCQNCYGRGRLQNGDVCSVCNGQGQVKSACGSCSGSGKVYCSDCNNEGRFLVQENVESFKTIKCKECDGKGKHTCRNCHGEGELRCEFCDGEGKLKGIKMFKKEFEIDKKRELFQGSGEETNITKEEISFIRDMKGNKIKIPLEDFYINVYLKDGKKEIFNQFVKEYQNSDSKKKTIYGKQIHFELGSYSYLGKIYRFFIQGKKIYKIELPETNSGKIIKNIVSAGFIAKGVLGNLFGKKGDLQKDLEELNNK